MYKRRNVSRVRLMTDSCTDPDPYDPFRGTPLYDAIYIAIDDFCTGILKPRDRVEMVVVSDGYDQRSIVNSADSINRLMDFLRQSGWRFVLRYIETDPEECAVTLNFDEVISRPYDHYNYKLSGISSERLHMRVMSYDEWDKRFYEYFCDYYKGNDEVEYYYWWDKQNGYHHGYM